VPPPLQRIDLLDGGSISHRKPRGHGDGGQLEVTRQWVWRRRGAWRR
jgi:hypothetical protein